MAAVSRASGQRKQRPSPSESATAYPEGTRRKGNDGRTYVVKAASNGVKRWILVATAQSAKPRSEPAKPRSEPAKPRSEPAKPRSGPAKPPQWIKYGMRREVLPGMRAVSIVDNGGIPFLVKLSSDKGRGMAHVYVYAGVNEQGVDQDAEPLPREDVSYKLWRSIPYLRAMVGLDPEEKRAPGGLLAGILSRLSVRSRQGAWWHGGNSLLLEEGRAGAHTFIGQYIMQFRLQQPKERIVEYWSTMGNSAVPYPYAVSDAGSYYFMTEGLVVSGRELYGAEHELDSTQQRDPYEVLYEGHLSRSKGFKEAHAMRSVKVLHQRRW